MASNITQGLYTIKIPDVSKLVKDHGRKNQEWFTQAVSASCSEKKKNLVRNIKLWRSSTYRTPSMTDVIEWQICAYPNGDDLFLYLHLLRPYSAVIDKFGYVNLLHDKSSDGSWMIHGNKRPGDLGKILEIPFEKGHLGKLLDLEIVRIGNFDNICRERASKDGCLEMKLAVWFNIPASGSDLRSYILTAETSTGRK